MAKKPTKGSYDTHVSHIPQGRRKVTARWQGSYGMYITGQTMIDDVTMLADRMDTKWGAGRLRLITEAGLREKFDRQRYMYNQAIWHGELEDVRQQSERMKKAWNALDKAATDNGHAIMLPEVWDITSEKGFVYAFVRNKDDAKVYRKEGRPVVLMSLEEVAAILDAQSLIGSAKEAFPDAEVVEVSMRAVGDLLGDITDTSRRLEDPLDDEIPF